MFYDLPNAAAAAYLKEFQIGALWVLTAPGQDAPAVVGFSGDLRAAVSAAKFKHSHLRAGAELRFVAWCSLADARRIVRTVASGCHGLMADVATAVSALQAVPARYGVPMQDHSKTLERASQSTALLAERVKQQSQNGNLSFLSKEYRRRRLAARAEGRGFMTWHQVQVRLRRAMAEHAAGGVQPATLLQRVFGDR